MSVQDLEAEDQLVYLRGREARQTGREHKDNPYGLNRLRDRCVWFAGYYDMGMELDRKKIHYRRHQE